MGCYGVLWDTVLWDAMGIYGPGLLAQEMAMINAKIAEAAVSGRLDRNPTLQGMLVRCINQLEKRERGITSQRGRSKTTSDVEVQLLESAALSLAIVGGNKQLCQELGQRMTPPKIDMDSLPSWGLPNPALSLLHEDQLEENCRMVDQQYTRTEIQKSRRLIMAMDATYLLPSVAQHVRQGRVGLVGAAWSPLDETQAFCDLAVNSKSLEKAATMMEFLLWDPLDSKHECYSIASSPMSLAAPRMEKQTQVHAGNWEPCFC